MTPPDRARLALVVQNAVRQDGQGRAMLELARVLSARGHAVTVFAHEVDESLRDRVQVTLLPRRRGPQLRDDLSVLRRATAEINRGGFDAACALGPTAAPSCPTVYYAQFSHRGWRASWDRTTRPGAYHRAHARALQRLEDRCVANAQRVIALSPATGEEIAGHTDVPVDIVPNGIDLEEFGPINADERGAARAELGLAAAAFVVGFLGDYRTSRKGLAPLVQAMGAGAPNDRLVVAGNGDAEMLNETARAAGAAERIVVPGFVNPRLVIAASDVVAVPSLYEPFSLVAVEAAACAVPVIVSSRVGAAPLLGAGALTVDDPAVPSSLAAALRTVREMGESERVSMGRAGRVAAEGLAWDITAGKAADIVEAVVAARTVGTRG